MQSKVSSKGWVVIPAALRRRYRLKPGSMIEFREEGEKILLIPRGPDPVEGLFGKLAGRISLTKALLEDRAAELSRTWKYPRIKGLRIEGFRD
ncbi:MAG: AbrB/MazE/SpoVT family DNA-binding domain-containing protein [Syntrophobacteraceae bacterium]